MSSPWAIELVGLSAGGAGGFVGRGGGVACAAQSITFGQKAIPYGQKAITFCQKAIPYGQKAIPFDQKAITFCQKAIPFCQKAITFCQKAIPFGQKAITFCQRAIPLCRKAITYAVMSSVIGTEWLVRFGVVVRFVAIALILRLEIGDGSMGDATIRVFRVAHR